MRLLLALLTLVGVGSAQDSRRTPFSPDSALAILRTLSVEIGPRPMGSPAEQRALAFAADRLRAAGLDDVRTLEIRTTPPGMQGRVRNTRSGVTIGTLRGTNGRMIVIGGHIDSASPEVPGTNDDGSGTAVVLELARALAQTEWKHTIVFCLFGGEEAGLVGSRVFVNEFPGLDSVDLMLQADMANGVDDLIPFMDKGTRQTPSWLLRAANEELQSLGYGGLSYPIHFFTWNIASGSGASSDHEPFLLRGIPAIDFTTDVSDPIHTPQDSWEWFRPAGIARTGDLLYRLVARFDGGMPAERTGSYVTVPLLSTFVLVPTWLLWVIIVGSIVAAGIVVVRRWSGRSERRGAERPQIPGLKVFGALTIVWTAIWSAENITALLSGWRSPWYAEPWIVIVPAMFMAMTALLLVARWTRSWNLSNDPFRYILRSSVWFTILIGIASLLSPRLAVYLALGLVLNVAAWSVRPVWLRITAVVVGAYPVVRLLTPEFFPFVARMFGMIPAHGVIAEAALTAGLALVCSVVALPYAFGALAVVRDRSIVWPTTVSYRYPALTWSVVAATVLAVAWAAMAEPYTPARPRSAHIVDTITEGNDSISTVITSSEWLRDLRIAASTGDTLVPGAVGRFVLPRVAGVAHPWLKVDTSGWATVDTGASAGGILRLDSERAPIQLSIRFAARRAGLANVDAGPYAVNRSDGSAEVIFDPPQGFPMTIPLSVRLHAPDTVTVTVEATFAGSAVHTAVLGGPLNLERRTVVTSTLRLAIPTIPLQP